MSQYKSFDWKALSQRKAAHLDAIAKIKENQKSESLYVFEEKAAKQQSLDTGTTVNKTPSNVVELISGLSQFYSFGVNAASPPDASMNIKNFQNTDVPWFNIPKETTKSSLREDPRGGPDSSLNFVDAYGGNYSPSTLGKDAYQPDNSDIVTRYAVRFPSLPRRSMTLLNGFPHVLTFESDYITPPDNNIYLGTGEFATLQTKYRNGLGGISYMAHNNIPLSVGRGGFSKLKRFNLEGADNVFIPSMNRKNGLAVSMNNFYNLACIETDFIIKTKTIPDEYTEGYCYNPDISNENSTQELQVVSEDFDVVESYNDDHFVAVARSYPESTGRFIDNRVFDIRKKNPELALTSSDDSSAGGFIELPDDFEFPQDPTSWQETEHGHKIDGKEQGRGIYETNIDVTDGVIELPDKGIPITKNFKISIQGTLYSIDSVENAIEVGGSPSYRKITLSNQVNFTDVAFRVYEPIYDKLSYDELSSELKNYVDQYKNEQNSLYTSKGLLLDKLDSETRLFTGPGKKYSSAFVHGHNFAAGGSYQTDFFLPITIQPENTGVFVITLDSGVANYFEKREDYEKAKPFNCNLMFDYNTVNIDHEGYKRREIEYHTFPYKAYIVPAKGWDFDVVGSLVKGIYYEYPFHPEDKKAGVTTASFTKGPENPIDIPVFTHHLTGTANNSFNYNNLPLTHMPFNFGPDGGWEYQSKSYEPYFTPIPKSNFNIQTRDGEGPYTTELTHGDEEYFTFYAPSNRASSVLSDSANLFFNKPEYTDERELSSNSIVEARRFNISSIALRAGSVKQRPLSDGFIDENLFPMTSNKIIRSNLKRPLYKSKAIGIDRTIPVKTKSPTSPKQFSTAVCGCGGSRGRNSSLPKIDPGTHPASAYFKEKNRRGAALAGIDNPQGAFGDFQPLPVTDSRYPKFPPNAVRGDTSNGRIKKRYIPPLRK
jgi:hypothetical protein